MVFLRSVFEIHFPSVVETCQIPKVRKLFILPKKQLREAWGSHSGRSQCFACSGKGEMPSWCFRTTFEKTCTI